MDHDCIWIGSVVAESNHPAFLAFLITAIGAMGTHLASIYLSHPGTKMHVKKRKIITIIHNNNNTLTRLRIVVIVVTAFLLTAIGAMGTHLASIYLSHPGTKLHK